MFVPFYGWESLGKERLSLAFQTGLWSLVWGEIHLLGHDKCLLNEQKKEGRGGRRRHGTEISECKSCGIISLFFFQHVYLCVYNKKYCKTWFYMRIFTMRISKWVSVEGLEATGLSDFPEVLQLWFVEPQFKSIYLVSPEPILLTSKLCCPIEI